MGAKTCFLTFLIFGVSGAGSKKNWFGQVKMINLLRSGKILQTIFLIMFDLGLVGSKSAS